MGQHKRRTTKHSKQYSKELNMMAFRQLDGLGFRVTALAAAVAAASTATAQELEEVVITGSRIPVNVNATSSVPVQSLSEEDIRRSGEINIADIVADIPALVSSQTAENSLTGSNALNLRGLGSARTLTLVNGRRHVAGFRGSQAVDVGTIPRALVKSVEVTTGGASAIYGADAVTGVVNFILKDDFEGFQIDVQGGVPERGAGETAALDAIWGKNFNEGRGNVVVALSYENDSGITYGDRSWSRDNGIASIGPRGNPDTSPGASPLAVVDDARFWLTSQEGSIAPSFGGRNATYVDINNNGIADCQESEGGRVGYLAGCWLTNPDGSVRVNQDGTVINSLWGTGGDGGRLAFNRDSLYPETDRAVINVNVNYDFSDTLSGFIEAKYVRSESTTFAEQDAFYDTLAILPDNPFIPAELAPVVDTTGYLLFTQDPLDFSDNNPFEYTRETQRVVAGFEWQPADNHTVEFSVNKGIFEETAKTTTVLLDRLYAAIDAVDNGAGETVCRSDIDPTAAYEIDYFAWGNGYTDFGAFNSDRYYTFTPGDGQCQPLNVFGTYSASKAAQDFITANLEDTLKIEQLVVNLTAFGELGFASDWLDGPIGYAAGIEYRDESSNQRLDPLTLGVLPEGTSFTAGQKISDIDDYLFTVTNFDNTQQFNTRGSYDVTDVFAEIRLPLLADRTMAKELTVDGAVRFADYSTIGNATTWKVGATWAPIDDIRFRGTVSEAVRAPNITELFDPKLPIQINQTEDPCAVTVIGNGSAERQANCVAELQAAGVPSGDIVDGSGNYIWVNPLTARFNGVSGGNPNLEEEVADTVTFGVIFAPSMVDGLIVSIDYWDVSIEEAISAVASDDILDGCLDSANYPNVPFCSSFTRRPDGGLNFLESGVINFAKLEAEGIDVSATYQFAVGQDNFEIRAVASRQKRLDRFFNPTDLTEVDPEIREIQRPRISASLGLTWDRGPMSVNLQTVYQSKQAVDEIEDVLGLNGSQALYGDAGFFDETYIVDVNGRYSLSDSLSVFAGVNNLTDETPFSTQTAWPVGPRGRTFVFGFSYSQ